MPLKDQLDYKCNIYKEENTTVNGTTRKVKTDLFTNIDCHFYRPNGSLKVTAMSENSENIVAKVIIEPDKKGIQMGDFIEVSFEWLEYWKYQIAFIKPNPSAKWLDSFELQLKNI